MIKAVRETAKSVKGRDDGDQAKRFPAFPQGTGREFHRLGTDRSPVRSARSRSCLWRIGDVRTGRAHGVAYPSAGADVDRHLRMRLDAVLGEPKEEIRPGDVIWCPPGKKHWHGATPAIAMSHIAIVEKLNGKAVDWMEQVSDEQYQAGS